VLFFCIILAFCLVFCVNVSLRKLEVHIFMEKWNQTSSDFILLGLLPRNQTGLLLLVLIIFIFSLALVGNSTMIYLIHVDSRLHTPMYFLLSQLSLTDLMNISLLFPRWHSTSFLVKKVSRS
jgi:hypothetical protein